MLPRVFLILFMVLSFAVPARAGFDEGRAAYNAKDWRGAITHLRPLAEYGDSRAMILLGNMYDNGFGVAQDYREAFRLYRRAAVLNSADGILAVSTMYQQGLGVAGNTKYAIGWLARGARLGQQTNAFFYAIQLYQGSKGKTYDMKPDLPAAYYWFRVAALKNSNPKIQSAAVKMAEAIAPKISDKEKKKADAAVANFKPLDIAAQGPLPDVEKEEVKKTPPQ